MRVLFCAISAIFSSFYALVATAQVPSIQLQQSFGGNNWDRMQSIKTTADGGYIMAGFTYSDNDGDVPLNHGSQDVWVVKVKSDGTIDWSKTYGGSDDEMANDVQQTSDGGYIIAASTYSTDGDVTFNHGFSDTWIIKLNNAGDIDWQYTYGGSDAEDVVVHIVQTNDGGYFVATGTKSFDGDVSSNHSLNFEDIWVFKLDPLGVLQWEKSLGGGNTESSSGVQQTADGGYIIAGQTNSNNGDVTGFHGGQADYWVIKLNNGGAIQWQRALGGVNDDYAYAVQQTLDGGYIVSGQTTSNGGNVSGNHGNNDVWVVKLNNAGTIQWQKCLGGTNQEFAGRVQQTSDGGYLVMSYTDSFDGDVVGNHNTNSDCWAVRLNNTGVIQWQLPIGSSSPDEPDFFALTPDGGFVFVGRTDGTDGDVTATNHGFIDAWFVKMGALTLPVRLLSFAGAEENNYVHLTWSTASEQNNDKFLVQRSLNGSSFETIGEVKSKGNGDDINNYVYDDLNLPANYNGNIYYRLQQVDIDDRVTISPVIIISRSTPVFAVKVLQNPAVNDLVLQCNTGKKVNCNIRILNSSGVTVKKHSQTLQQGTTLLYQSIESLPAGTYMAEVSDGRTSVVVKFVK